ncbi:MAG: NAD(P)-dependent alcohol dehydrogenase, partial [Bacteroidales bacterium]|nr:NAD(P)-dependent alcohol dehydrogenase [Bacteroidales bacterium]
MKAAVIYEYGEPEVFRYEDISQPEIREDEVLVEVHAASVNPVDWKQRKGNHKFFLRARFPIVPGYDISGRVEKCGSKVTKFKDGDQVFCRLTKRFGGAFAEYASARESTLSLKPENMDHIHAAGIPMAGQTALQALRDKARIKPGQKILIIGAAGGVGHYALQLSKIFGAETTAVCTSRHEKLLDLLKPDHHIDYRKEDYLEGNKLYDIIFDAAGVNTFLSCQKILAPGGIYITVLPRPKLLVHKIIALFTRGKKVRSLLQKSQSSDLEVLKKLVEEEKLISVIDSIHPLDKVSEAHRRAESYSTEGKII